MVEALAVLIRPARAEDLPALEWEGEYRHFRQVYRRAFIEASRGRRVLLLAEVDGQVVGQIFLQVDSRTTGPGTHSAYLYALRVRTAHRNQGIGTRLVQDAEAVLRLRGYQRALISVAKDNPDALRLYQRLGYRVCAEDPGRWSYMDDEGRLREVEEPAYVLEKRL